MNDVAPRPSAAHGQIFTGLGTRQRLTVDCDLCSIRPPRDSQIESELRRLSGRDDHFYVAIPGIVRLLRDLQSCAILQMPVEVRVVVEMYVNAIAAGAVEISWQRAERALQ